jgi:hypothetical protein
MKGTKSKMVQVPNFASQGEGMAFYGMVEDRLGTAIGSRKTPLLHSRNDAKEDVAKARCEFQKFKTYEDVNRNVSAAEYLQVAGPQRKAIFRSDCKSISPPVDDDAYIYGLAALGVFAATCIAHKFRQPCTKKVRDVASTGYRNLVRKTRGNHASSSLERV